MPHRKIAPLDNTACEREPLELIGAMQAPFHLVAFCPATFRCRAATEGAEAALGAAPGSLASGDLEAALGAPAASWIRRATGGEAYRRQGFVAFPNGRLHWVELVRLGPLLGLEIDIEETGATSGLCSGVEALGAVGALGTDLEIVLDGTAPTGTVAFDLLTDRFRAICGYDRVMIYRFDQDWNGTVIAESARDGLPEGYLGLTFPSSDIPRPARDLFLANAVRPIIDVEAAPIPLRGVGPALDDSLAPDRIDLSECRWRAISPIHLQYLRNMGVRATLTIALRVRGQLWGLLTSHHYSGPRRLSQAETALCRAFADLFSSMLSEATLQLVARALAECRRFRRALRSRALGDARLFSPEDLLTTIEDDLLAMLDCDGLILDLGEGLMRFGRAPPPEQTRTLMARLAALAAESGQHSLVTSHLAGFWPDHAEAFGPEAAGALAVFREDGGTLVALRGPRPNTVSWGGDPRIRVTSAAEDGRLQPRASFEAWQELTRDRSPPWPEIAEEQARDLLTSLAEISWILAQRRAEHDLVAARDQAESALREVEHAAMHDDLTGLANRRSLAAMLAALSGPAQPPDRIVAALHIDLDRFKQINDTLGQSTGDAVLVHVARVIERERRGRDAAFRVGGDEFVLIVPRVETEAELADLAGRLITALSRPIEVEGQTCHVGASIGIATERATLLDPGTLLSRADIALYESKERGRGRFTFVTDEMEARRLRRRALGEDILRALSAREFSVFYQLQFDARTRQPSGAEALVRWIHPERGIVAPADFLSGAEEVGVIGEIDRFVMQTAVADRAAWERAGLRVPRVSVNVSARRLGERGLVDCVARLGLPPGVLAFELLETIDLQKVDAMSQWNLDALRELGLEIEVDDFGTGHTSILSLVRLRPHALKIDRELVAPVGSAPAALRLVQSIVEIAHGLGIRVIAEGVETETQVALLTALGCDTLQGHGLARPMPADQVRAWLGGTALTA